MRIYIASSWKNQHAVELITVRLRDCGHEVESFVEQAVAAEGRGENLKFDVTAWIASPSGEAKFRYDTKWATQSDCVIYVGPSGTDAWAEVGAAWAANVPILGLWAKGEQAGLMRRMVRWFGDYRELIRAVAVMAGTSKTELKALATK